MTDQNKGLSYSDAGVDIDAGNDLVERIKPSLKKTNSDSAARITKNKFSKTYLDLIFAKSLRISR